MENEDIFENSFENEQGEMNEKPCDCEKESCDFVNSDCKTDESENSDCTCEDCNCEDGECSCEDCDCVNDNCTCDCNKKCECDENSLDCEKDEKSENCKNENESDADNSCKTCGESEDNHDMFEHLIKLQAEFDNYRKRTENEVGKAYKSGFTDAIVDFLPALDSFKMATEMITDKNTLIGIQYIEKGILATLEKMGVSTIDATGKFDPNFHQAIDTDDSADVESGYIVKECAKGFRMGDKVIRYSQVIVKK